MTKSSKGTVANPAKNVAAKYGQNSSILERGWGLFRKRFNDKATDATTPVTIVAINPTIYKPALFGV